MCSMASACFGDFDGEPDDVVRGMTLQSFADGSGASNFAKMEHMCTSAHSARDFEVSDVAPELSQEMQAHVEHTMLQLSKCVPMVASNNVLTFLRNMVDAKVKKVNHEKFSIRAEVIVDGLSCDIKMRIYQQEQGSTVEFQRRAGDTVTFHRLYRQAAAYLRAPASHQAAVQVSSPPRIAHVVALPTNEAIAPLLEMAKSTSNVHLLAEVASALSAMARDPMVVEHLRLPCSMSVLQQLQQEHDFRVACPTAHMLSCF